MKRIFGAHSSRNPLSGLRLASDALLEEIYDAAASVTRRDVLVYVEENPSNLS